MLIQYLSNCCINILSWNIRDRIISYFSLNVIALDLVSHFLINFRLDLIWRYWFVRVAEALKIFAKLKRDKYSGEKKQGAKYKSTREQT